MKSNIFKTALLFEGGSMREAYTSAVTVKLLHEGVYFNNVYGVSAGSTNIINYLSRDKWRAAESFTGFMGDPKVASVLNFAKGKGYFDAPYIYQQVSMPGEPLGFNYEKFMANPAECCIVSFDRDTGEDLFFTKADMPTPEDVLVRVRASSTLPIAMIPPQVGDHVCYDGGFAVGGGLPLQKMADDGFEKVVVLRTRKRGYRKEMKTAWSNAFFWRYPKMREAVEQRAAKYNEACDMLDQWEKDGRAYVFYCDDLTLGGMEMDVPLLRHNYELGFSQICREWNDLAKFLESAEG